MLFSFWVLPEVALAVDDPAATFARAARVKLKMVGVAKVTAHGCSTIQY